jgi:hypothetical protein
MSWIRHLYHRVRALFKPSPRNVADALGAKAKAEALALARGLTFSHGIEVRELNPGEEPAQPKAVDLAFEEEWERSRPKQNNGA